MEEKQLQLPIVVPTGEHIRVEAYLRWSAPPPKTKAAKALTNLTPPTALPSGFHLLQPEKSEKWGAYKFWDLKRDLPLSQLAADFYLILDTEIDNPYDVELQAKKQQLCALLSNQFSRYLDMAVGGELRHADNQSSFNGHWPAGQGEKPCDSGDCPYEHYREREVQRDKSYKDSEGIWHHRIRTTIHGKYRSECDFYGTCPGVSETTDYYVQSSDEAWLKKPWAKTLSQMLKNGGELQKCPRANAWVEWAKLRKRGGIEVLKRASEIFHLCEWSSGYGGHSWGTAADTLIDYLTGKSTTVLFVDTAFGIHHNGGVVFDKMWSVADVDRVLDLNLHNAIHELKRYASLEVINIRERLV